MGWLPTAIQGIGILPDSHASGGGAASAKPLAFLAASAALGKLQISPAGT